MNLFSKLFGQKTLTADWRHDPSVPLVVELTNGQFCGVSLGSGLEGLRHLGPSTPAWVNGPEKTLIYPAQGLLVLLDDAQRLEGVDINLVAEEEMSAFAGSWHWQGASLQIDAHSPPAAIKKLLGNPAQSDRLSLCYHHNQHEVWFEWGEDGRLENVMLTTL